MKFIEPVSFECSSSSFSPAGQPTIPAHGDLSDISVGRRQVGFDSAVEPLMNDSNAYSHRLSSRNFEPEQSMSYASPVPHDPQASVPITNQSTKIKIQILDDIARSISCKLLTRTCGV